MKYKVIGWVDEYSGYPKHKVITAPVSNAIIKEIRKNKYLFGGDWHDHCMPLLNDGTYVDYSWRGWGGVMARAYNIEGDYAYMFGYMDSLLNPDYRKYPKTDDFDESQIVPRETLIEKFVMHLNDDMFDAMKNGTKIIEVRLFDKKRKQIDVDDYIEFRRASNEKDRIIMRVSDLYVRKTFKNIYEDKYFNEKHKYVRRKKEWFGGNKDSSIKSMVDMMHSIYSEDDEKKYGAIAFILTKPHSCLTRLLIDTDSLECFELYNNQLSDPKTSKEERKRLIDESMNVSLIDKALSEISDEFEQEEYIRFIYGENTDYISDINIMLRKTLKGLFGKEGKLKEIQKRYCAAMTLEIRVTIVKGCDENKPKLSLAKDIVKFLSKSGVKPNIEIYIV
ncbi:MAG TPA: hypothetical protein DCY93_03570 [Firmicutes bacterium]|nr:hypothetical protein [Bacillota bacterium]